MAKSLITVGRSCMNIFEGSRRIAKLIAAGIAVGFLIAFAYDNPEPVSVAYLITDDKTPPTRVSECGSGTENRETLTTSKRGESVRVFLCFKFPEVVLPSGFVLETARTATLSELLYMKSTLNSFQIPESDGDYISRARWTQALKDVGVYVLGMLASIAVFWAFIWAVGWVVRGFMGISWGKDSKE